MGVRLSKEAYRILHHASLGSTYLYVLGLPPLKQDQHLLDTENKYQRQERYWSKRRIKRLADAGLIVLGDELVTLSRKGKLLLQQHQKLQGPAVEPTWDGIWRIICYDIPNSQSKNRRAFQQQLRGWGFQRIQKSLWVYPYPCKELVATLAHQLDIGKYVLHMQTEELPGVKRLIHLFNLKVS